MFSEVRKAAKKAGLPPGTATYTGDKNNVTPVIKVLCYDTKNYTETSGETLNECLPIPPTAGITWINVKGLHDTSIIEDIAQRYNIHPLTVEDILNLGQRPKVEEYDGYLYSAIKLLQWQKKSSTFSVKQLSLILGKNFVLTFHDSESPIFDAIYNRFKSTATQRLRQQGPDYLFYRIIDAAVDQYFILLESLGDLIEDTEEHLITTFNPQNARLIYKLKRQMLLLRKAVWPMRDAASHLLHVEEDLITNFTRIYMRDLYDHVAQVMDTVETFRDMLSSMLDMYLSIITNRMNEIMKTLTIITTIFIPITAIASIYGMNFLNIPGLHWEYGYYAALSVMFGIAIAMVIYFKIKKWF